MSVRIGLLSVLLLGGCAADPAPPAPPPTATTATTTATTATAAATTATATGWTEPAAYSFVVTAGCTLGFWNARYEVTVRDGEVASKVALNDQARRNPGFQPPTLGRLDRLITEIKTGTEEVRGERDPVDGHPIAYGFDQQAMAVDAGVCYEVGDYHAG